MPGTFDLVAAGNFASAGCRRLETDGRGWRVCRTGDVLVRFNGKHSSVGNHGRGTGRARRTRKRDASKYGHFGARFFYFRTEKESRDFARQSTSAEIAIWRGGGGGDICLLLCCEFCGQGLSRSKHGQPGSELGDRANEYESPADRAGHRPGRGLPVEFIRLQTVSKGFNRKTV